VALTVLLTESDSPYGLAISQRLEGKLLNAVMLQSGAVDWQDDASVRDCMALHQPTIVVSTLLPLNVDDPVALGSYERACECLARVCREQDIACIHISSYRVYGTHNRVGDEADTPDANTDIATALLRAEATMATIPHHVIVRFSWPIGSQSDNLLTQLLTQLLESPTVYVNNIYVGTPTSFYEIARSVVAIVMQVAYGADNWGVMNYVCSDSCTEEEFAHHLCELLDELGIVHGAVEVAEQETLTLIAKGSALLDGRRCQANFGIQPRSWHQGLIHFLRVWKEQYDQGLTESDASAATDQDQPLSV